MFLYVNSSTLEPIVGVVAITSLRRLLRSYESVVRETPSQSNAILASNHTSNSSDLQLIQNGRLSGIVQTHDNDFVLLVAVRLVACHLSLR